MELSLSNALLDGIISRGRQDSDETEVGGSDEVIKFPALVYSDPHKALDQRILFKPPAKKHDKKKGTVQPMRRYSEITTPPTADLHKRNWDEAISQFFSKRKKSLLTPLGKTGTLCRSLSWDAIHQLQKREEEEEEETVPQTFVYKPQVRVRRFSRQRSPQNDLPSAESTSSSTTKESSDSGPHLSDTPTIPPRNDQLQNQVYEVPVTPVKPPRSKKTQSEVPPAITPRKKKPELRRESFTVQDIVSPPSKLVQESKPLPQAGNEECHIGLLKIKVLAVRIPQAPVSTANKDSHDTDDEESPVGGPVAKVTPKDGLFCVLSVNGKHSQYESSLQPLNPIMQASVWDQVESEAVFYASHTQQVFVMSRTLPLSHVSSNDTDQQLSSKAKAECIGVGILPIATLPPLALKEDRGSVEDWTKVVNEDTETTVTLEPHGSVLLKASFTCLQPQASVSCTGSVTVTGLYGVNCFREGEACWTCCTVDIDSENFGTTSSKIGMDDCLSEGWLSEPIDFDAKRKMSCRIQLWGFTSQETEYWFGEVYIPLALVLPYSKQIVHQDGDDGPLALLDSFEREITMPIEPKGHITVRFAMSPVQDETEELIETIKALEESGLFRPEAIAQLKSEVEHEKSMSNITTIPEEGPSNLPPSSMMVSGVYDHLSPPPPPTSPTASLTALSSLSRTLNKKKMTMRLLGNLKLEVPKSYDERKHMIKIDTDPSRELEIVKVELKDVKVKLASSEFYREKAELKIKTLEDEIWKLKKKSKTKKK